MQQGRNCFRWLVVGMWFASLGGQVIQLVFTSDTPSQQAEQDLLRSLRENGFGFAVGNNSYQSSPPPTAYQSPPPSPMEYLSEEPGIPLDDVYLQYLSSILAFDNEDTISADQDEYEPATIDLDEGDGESLTQPLPEQYDISSEQSQQPPPVPGPDSETLPALQQVIQFAEFLSGYPLPNNTGSLESVGTFENFDNLATIEQNQCFTELDWTLIGLQFNAIGVVRVGDKFGNYTYCAGTLINEQMVLTMKTCLRMQESEVVSYAYQPAWEVENWWNVSVTQAFNESMLRIDQAMMEYAVLKLDEKINDAVTMHSDLVVEQAGTCWVTVLGWLQSTTPSKNFQLIECPSFPEIRELLGIQNDSCSADLCDMDLLDLAQGSPIVLVCDPFQQSKTTSYSVIGMLKYFQDTEPKMSLPYRQHLTVLPYMFESSIYRSIADTVAVLQTEP
eukprot:TRINITY_DN5962_c0_g1_i1.p1 TRINITY_DN5962_c0_g1~~TRINITY_DN5962_c0_g1_i1.p1  ORF type:complete len:493 (+),score=31.74 TRINITY_DN5962_c0_g1_i1:143-1480(+)